jgi:hypothetical protein
VAVALPELYIKKIIIKYYPTAVITKLRILIRVKLIIFIDIFYALIKSKEDIEIRDA